MTQDNLLVNTLAFGCLGEHELIECHSKVIDVLVLGNLLFVVLAEVFEVGRFTILVEVELTAIHEPGAEVGHLEVP